MLGEPAQFLATGVSYRRLPVSGLEELVGRGVFYGAAVTEAQAMAGQPVLVVGGANAAGQAAVHLARYAGQVTLLVRGPGQREGAGRCPRRRCSSSSAPSPTPTGWPPPSAAPARVRAHRPRPGR
jgi:Pyridine nucleotide-disulphide oxidoreductase